MDTSLLYLENTEITNETQLTFQEHKVQKLISKQIDLQYGVSDLMTMITLLIAVSTIVLSLITNRLMALSIPKNTNEKVEEEKNSIQSDIKKYLTFHTIIISVTLLGCLYYGFSGFHKETDDQISIQKQISATIASIHAYETSKAQREELQKLKASPPKCICTTPKIKKPCKN